MAKYTIRAGKHIHSLVEKDTDKLIGNCSRCGYVKLKVHKTKTGNRYQCLNAYKDNIAASNQKRLYVGPHGLNKAEAVEFISNKVCAICRTDLQLCVDHDHQTMELRGVLCGRHNRGLGMFDDDPEMLRRAADYLEGILPVARSTKPTGDGFYGMSCRNQVV